MREHIYISRSTSRATKKLKHFEIHIYIYIYVYRERERERTRDGDIEHQQLGTTSSQIWHFFLNRHCVLSFLAGGRFARLPNSISFRTLAKICVVLLLLLLLWNVLLLLLIVFCISRLDVVVAVDCIPIATSSKTTTTSSILLIRCIPFLNHCLFLAFSANCKQSEQTKKEVTLSIIVVDGDLSLSLSLSEQH